MKIGTENIEKVVDAIGHLVLAGKKISEDKKVDLNDLPVLIELGKKLPEIVAAFKSLEPAFSEVKDLDVQEVIDLIVKINDKVKEIEQA